MIYAVLTFQLERWRVSATHRAKKAVWSTSRRNLIRFFVIYSLAFNYISHLVFAAVLCVWEREREIELNERELTNTPYIHGEIELGSFLSILLSPVQYIIFILSFFLYLSLSSIELIFHPSKYRCDSHKRHLHFHRVISFLSIESNQNKSSALWILCIM